VNGVFATTHNEEAYLKPKKFQRVILRIAVAIGIVLLAASLRLWPLQALGLRLAYLTFYPAVMIAALYGGIFTGLLATVLSVLVVYFWQPSGQPFIQDSADWLGMAVFSINGIMVSLICEYMLRVRIRMTDALAQANHFGDALNQVSAYIYMKDRRHRYVYANRPTLELFKCSAEELVGSEDSRFFSPEAVARLHAIDTRVLESGEDTAEEVVDGQRIYWEIKAPIYDDVDKGRIWGLCGISTDITERKRLESVAKHYEAIIQSSEDAIISKSLDGIVTSWNPGAEAMFGYSAEEMIGKSMHILLPKDREDEEDVILERLKQGEKIAPFETVRLCKEGKEIHVSVTISPIHGSRGEIIGASKIARDITERKRQEAALLESEERFRSTFDAAAVGMALVDLEGRFIQVNAALCHLVGYTEAELTQKTFQDITHPDDLESDLALLNELLSGTRQSYQMEKRYVKKDGRVIWILLSGSAVRDSTGKVLYFVGQIQDINERKVLLDRLERQAQQDYLTGLCNRRFFLEQAETELARAQRYDNELSLFMLDIDHFKAINDTYGHATGDVVLQTLSHILRETLRSVDIIGRWGGEEFVILLPETDAQEAAEIAERLRDAIDHAKVTMTTGLPLHFTASIGITTLKEKDINIDILLNYADEALYQAKNTGRNKVCIAD
jgi:diguanylate cyclase (GGDEF)-like protein/PAS domain S-box-containing protein